MLRQAWKPGASAEIVLAHFITLIRPAGYQLAPEVSREEPLKYAKVMACITTATSTFVVFRYSQLILHKLMLSYFGGITKSWTWQVSHLIQDPYWINFSALHIQALSS